MYLFEASIETKGKLRHKTRSIEITENYDLAEAWHNAIESFINTLSDDERISSIELIAY